MFSRLAKPGLLCLIIFMTFFQAYYIAEAAPSVPSDWNLDDIYPGQAAWDREAATIRETLSQIAALKAEPIEGPEDLARLLDLITLARGKAGKMAKVGLLLSIVDTTSEDYGARREQGELLEGEVEGTVSFLTGTLLGIGEESLTGWLKSSDHLKKHQRRILRTLYLGRYSWPARAAEFEAQLTRLPRTANDFYEALQGMDLGWPEVDGIELGPFTHSQATRSPDDGLRHRAYEEYFNFLARFQEPFALALTRRIEGDLMIARARNLDDSVDTLLVLKDGFSPKTHRAVTPAIRNAKPQISLVVEALRKAYGLETLSLDDIRARKLEIDLDFDFTRARDMALKAAALVSKNYADQMAARLNEPWMHLTDDPHKGEDVGVFWQVGGGNPHAIFKFRNNLTSSRGYASAAFLMMAYAAVPEDQSPDLREEDFPVFGNAIWALGPELHDTVLLAELPDKEDQVTILAQQLARYLRFVLMFQSMVDLETKIGDIINQGQTVSATQVSDLYRQSLQDIFGGTGIIIPDYWRYAWMDKSFAFYGPHYASFVLAEVTKLLLKNGLMEGDPTIRHLVDQGIAESKLHLSAEVMGAAGFDLADPESYQAVFREMASVARRLLETMEE